MEDGLGSGMSVYGIGPTPRINYEHTPGGDIDHFVGSRGMFATNVARPQYSNLFRQSSSVISTKQKQHNKLINETFP